MDAAVSFCRRPPAALHVHGSWLEPSAPPRERDGGKEQRRERERKETKKY